jgi:hypothetical protein
MRKIQSAVSLSFGINSITLKYNSFRNNSEGITFFKQTWKARAFSHNGRKYGKLSFMLADAG